MKSNQIAGGLDTDFLPGGSHPLRPADRIVRWLAVMCVVALGASGLHLIRDRSRPAADPVALAAQVFADGQAAAFTESASLSGAPMTPQSRAAGLPDQAVAGLSWSTAAGPMRLVLPGGLGPAQTTRDGQVVYPDAGSGFDFLAENTPSGTRTVARINSPAGVRAVTTFLRTTVDVVMLAHTNGYITLNRTEPSAQTVAMIAPSEARDANGQLVPSSYVVRQYGIGLYQLSEVIAPTEKTAWPVYVDPPVSVLGPGGAPLPAVDFSAITDTISGAASAVAGAATAAASATVSGVSAVGTFVSENPLESAMLVGGVALSLTGVGGPAGAAVIAAAAVNVSSNVVDVVAAHNPDSVFLGDLSTVLSAASMITPQGGAKKIVGEGLEVAITQAGRHADDVAEAVVDVAKAVPTPPTQLAQDVANAAIPKIPNAPPGAAVTRGTDFTPPLRDKLYNAAIKPDGNLYCTYCGSRVYIQDGPTLKGDIIPRNRAQIDHYNPRKLGGNGVEENGYVSCIGCNLGKGAKSPQEFEAEREVIADRSRESIANYEAQHGTQPDGVIRTPNDRSPLPAAEQEQPNTSAADQQRNSALETARENNNSSADRSDNDQNSNPGSRPSQQKKDKEDKKSKMHHPKPTG